MNRTLPPLDSPEALHRFLPHRGKMLLISRVLSYDVARHSVITEYDVGPECIFFDESAGGVPSWAGFEMMAQSISIISSLERFYNGTLEQAKPGVILSVNGFSAAERLLPAVAVQIAVREDLRQDDVYRYECELRAGEKQLCTGVITVMETRDMTSFFGEKYGL